MADATSAGFTFARALAEALKSAPDGVGLPGRDWLLEVVPRLEVEAILFHSPATEEIALDGYGQTGKGEGTVLLFADGSFLFVDDDATIDTDEVEADVLVDMDAPFASFDEVTILAISAPLMARHPDLEAWASSMPDDPEIDPLGAICDAIADRADPSIDGIDMTPCATWGDETASAMEEAIVDAWLGLGISEPCEISVFSGIEDGERAYVQIECPLKTIDSDLVTQRMTEILDTLVGLDGLLGHTWEYNDGAYDRVSGYSQYAETVATASFDPAEDFSNHRLIEAQNSLIEKLMTKGKTRPEALALVQLQPHAA